MSQKLHFSGSSFLSQLDALKVAAHILLDRNSLLDSEWPSTQPRPKQNCTCFQPTQPIIVTQTSQTTWLCVILHICLGQHKRNRLTIGADTTPCWNSCSIQTGLL